MLWPRRISGDSALWRRKNGQNEKSWLKTLKLRGMEAMLIDPDLTTKTEFAKYKGLSGLIDKMAERLGSEKLETTLGSENPKSLDYPV